MKTARRKVQPTASVLDYNRDFIRPQVSVSTATKLTRSYAYGPIVRVGRDTIPRGSILLLNGKPVPPVSIKEETNEFNIDELFRNSSAFNSDLSFGRAFVQSYHRK